MALQQLPWHYATDPKTGHVIVDAWWFVGPEGPIFYRNAHICTAQCNPHEAVLSLMKNTHPEYANLKLMRIPQVYLGSKHKQKLISYND